MQVTEEYFKQTMAAYRDLADQLNDDVVEFFAQSLERFLLKLGEWNPESYEEINKKKRVLSSVVTPDKVRKEGHVDEICDIRGTILDTEYNILGYVKWDNFFFPDREKGIRRSSGYDLRLLDVPEELAYSL